MKEDKLKRILEIEAVLIELSMRGKSDDPKQAWSSRVQAERIYKIAKGKSKEKIAKPWEHFSFDTPKNSG